MVSSLLSAGVVHVFVGTINIRCHLLFVEGFKELSEKVKERLNSRERTRKYSKRNHLSRRMLSENPLFGDFVTG